MMYVDAVAFLLSSLFLTSCSHLSYLQLGMFSAHFEEALLSASDEELRNFFAELPLAARRRLIAVLAEVDAASAQHFLDTNRLDDDADLADLQWPSDPEQPSVRQPSPAPSESSSDVSLASWGMTSAPSSLAFAASRGSQESCCSASASHPRSSCCPV